MGHYSAGFTLDMYGHLMESVRMPQVEWIDELVFPEGWEAALKLHLWKGRARQALPSLSSDVVHPIRDPRSCIYPCRLGHTVYCELGLPITWRVLSGTMQFEGSPGCVALSGHAGVSSRSL